MVVGARYANESATAFDYSLVVRTTWLMAGANLSANALDLVPRSTYTIVVNASNSAGWLASSPIQVVLVLVN